jgi:7-carboxy-7-deazaguanine synthase
MKSKSLKPVYNNRNIPKKQVSGEILPINQIFTSIQTEGPFSGLPATFIRLFGCNLNCSFCDTPQNEPPTMMKVKSIIKDLKGSRIAMVVITGGEPFLYNMEPLVKALLKNEFWIQFETSGSLPPKGLALPMEGVRIICSPKTKTINDDIAKHALAFKYVVCFEDADAVTGLPRGAFIPDNMPLRVMVSPKFTDDKKETDANIAYAVKITKYHGYWLSIQYHKLIDIQ